MLFWLGLAQTPLAQSQDRLSLIRDAEIENTLRVFAAPIFKAADLDFKSVQMHIVNDNTLNAYVTKGQHIFFNTGLLIKAENAAQVMGVIAHEAGHITAGHLVRMHQNLATAKNISIAGLLLGLPLAVVTGEPDALLASQQLSQQIATRSFLDYSRSMEQAADQAAVNFFDQANLSAKGLYTFMKILDQHGKLFSGSQNPYVRTHPLTSSRVTFLREHLANSPYSNQALPAHYDALHYRMQAKLIGYLRKKEEVLRRYPPSLETIPALYARAIALMRSNETEKALELADRLLILKPEDAFFFELKGDIYKQANALTDALPWYEKALEKLPWASFIHYNVAQILSNQAEPDGYEKALYHLRQTLSYDSNLVMAWRLAAKIYAKQGKDGLAALSQAEAALRIGDKAQALHLAKKAQGAFAAGTPIWQQAQDIIFQIHQDTPTSATK